MTILSYLLLAVAVAVALALSFEDFILFRRRGKRGRRSRKYFPGGWYV